MEVNTMTLCESFCYKACFIANNFTINIAFDAKQPFTPYNVLLWRWGNKRPCSIFRRASNSSLIAFLQCSYFIASRTLDGSTFSMRGYFVTCHLIDPFWFKYIILGTCDHMIWWGCLYNLCGRIIESNDSNGMLNRV